MELQIKVVEGKWAIERHKNLLDAFFRGLESRLKMNFGSERRFVWAVDPGQVLQFSPSGPGVQSFWVAAFTFRQRSVHKDFKELSRWEQRPDAITLRPEGANERDDCDEPGIDEKPSNLGCATNILDTIGFRKGKVPIQAAPDLVSVEAIGVAADGIQTFLEGDRDGGFAGGRKARQPETGRPLCLLHGAGILVDSHRYLLSV